MSRKTEIKISVLLDDKKMPEKIEWQADDAGFKGYKGANTMMLSLWDVQDKVTLGVDLWTNNMLVDDMNIHFYQIFLKMADTYRRATNNSKVSESISNFASEFAENLELFKK